VTVAPTCRRPRPSDRDTWGVEAGLYARVPFLLESFGSKGRQRNRFWLYRRSNSLLPPKRGQMTDKDTNQNRAACMFVAWMKVNAISVSFDL
jgi:hypothetical protein